MRALIRGSEVYPESEWTAWTRAHLAWECTPRPDGNGYVMVEDWEPETEVGESVTETSEAQVETYTINGKTYTKDELEKLVNQ